MFRPIETGVEANRCLGQRLTGISSVGTMEAEVPTEQQRKLAEIRVEQRRRLRAIPNDFFESVKWDDPPPKVPVALDALDLELFVRGEADAALTAESASYLDERSVGIAADWRRRAVRSLDGTFLGPAKSRLESTIDVTPPDPITDVHDAINQTLCDFLLLAILADHLAADGYADSRGPIPR